VNLALPPAAPFSWKPREPVRSLRRSPSTSRISHRRFRRLHGPRCTGSLHYRDSRCSEPRSGTIYPARGIERRRRYGIAFFNPSLWPATINMKLLDSAGSISFAAPPLNLKGQSHLARFVSELFPAAGNFGGTLALSAGPPVSAMTLRQHTAPLSYTTLPVAPAPAMPSSRGPDDRRHRRIGGDIAPHLDHSG